MVTHMQAIIPMISPVGCEWVVETVCVIMCIYNCISMYIYIIFSLSIHIFICIICIVTPKKIEKSNPTKIVKNNFSIFSRLLYRDIDEHRSNQLRPQVLERQHCALCAGPRRFGDIGSIGSLDAQGHVGKDSAGVRSCFPPGPCQVAGGDFGVVLAQSGTAWRINPRSIYIYICICEFQRCKTHH